MDTINKQYGLIFDIDGVIADTEAVNAKVSIKVFTDLFGINVVREDFEAGLGRGAEEYVKAAARVHGLELTNEQVEKATKLRQEYFLKILSEEPLPPFPGVLELMAEAMQRVGRTSSRRCFDTSALPSLLHEYGDFLVRSGTIGYPYT